MSAQTHTYNLRPTPQRMIAAQLQAIQQEKPVIQQIRWHLEQVEAAVGRDAKAAACIAMFDFLSGQSEFLRQRKGFRQTTLVKAYEFAAKEPRVRRAATRLIRVIEVAAATAVF